MVAQQPPLETEIKSQLEESWEGALERLRAVPWSLESQPRWDPQGGCEPHILTQAFPQGVLGHI